MDEKRRAAIITASDKGYAGLREDLSGQVIKRLLEDENYDVIEMIIVPDERAQLRDEMKRLCDKSIDLILTTGGTGFSKRDVTPEATEDVIERKALGISQGILQYSLALTKRAMLSRGTAGIRGETLIINLPGSPKAVEEVLTYILPTLEHGIAILKGTTGECARS